MIPQYKTMTWAGWILTGLVVLVLTASGCFKLVKPPMLVEEFTEKKFGYQEEVIVPIGVVELGCVLLFLVPQTSVLGAILLTGYFGGAIATHVRISDNFSGGIIIGVLVWLALFLRDARIRALLPIRWHAAPEQNTP